MLLPLYQLQGQAKQMEALWKEIKMMSIKERYNGKSILTALFEEKEIVYLDTDRFGRISMLQWHNKEPYQVYRCNQHKNVELAYHGCFQYTDTLRRLNLKKAEEWEEQNHKNLEGLLG